MWATDYGSDGPESERSDAGGLLHQRRGPHESRKAQISIWQHISFLSPGSGLIVDYVAIAPSFHSMWATITVKQEMRPTSQPIRGPHHTGMSGPLPMESPAHLDRNTQTL
jgi:hypothetical protein